jgi:hypothetical protein
MPSPRARRFARLRAGVAKSRSRCAPPPRAATLRRCQAPRASPTAELEAGDDDDAQELMARVTGNYRRGNERTAKQHPRNQG